MPSHSNSTLSQNDVRISINKPYCCILGIFVTRTLEGFVSGGVESSLKHNKLTDVEGVITHLILDSACGATRDPIGESVNHGLESGAFMRC